MKILKEFEAEEFDAAIFGIGFESRSIEAAKTYQPKAAQSFALGYDTNTNIFSYQRNKDFFTSRGVQIFEGNETNCLSYISEHLTAPSGNSPLNILIDISVMSRNRLANILYQLTNALPTGTKISITYSLSQFVPPPQGSSPIRHLGEISKNLTGSLGDLSKPSSVIFGLGYERGKASGVINFLDPGCIYVFIPNSPIPQFKDSVIENNLEIIESIPESNIFEYDVCNPYSTYLSIRSLILSIRRYSRPLVVPLGPKILASLSVFLGIEMYPNLPVWRVSSELLETPVDRKASSTRIEYTIEI